MNGSQPNEAFRWTQASWGRALVCTPLEILAPHVFTTRDLDYLSTEEHRHDAVTQIAASLGVALDRLVRLRQVHGAGVYRADGVNLPESSAPPAADAAITSDPSIALAVRVADCVPILLADSASRTVAAVHAGWRGTAAGIAAATVRALQDEGVDPERLIAALGPGIGPCCYEVGEELIDAFESARHATADVARWFSRTMGGSLRLDVPGANRDQLAAAGVPRDRIFAADFCTACQPDLFYSFRREGAGTGRMAAAIRPREVAPQRP